MLLVCNWWKCWFGIYILFFFFWRFFKVLSRVFEKFGMEVIDGLFLILEVYLKVDMWYFGIYEGNVFLSYMLLLVGCFYVEIDFLFRLWIVMMFIGWILLFLFVVFFVIIESFNGLLILCWLFLVLVDVVLICRVWIFVFEMLGLVVSGIWVFEVGEEFLCWEGNWFFFVWSLFVSWFNMLVVRDRV